jgi:hypothetical protein
MIRRALEMVKMLTNRATGNGRGMSADNIYYYANWALIGALVLGVIATYAIVASGNIRDSSLRRVSKKGAGQAVTGMASRM